MTPEEQTLFRNLLESAKVLRACARNLLYDLAPGKWPDGWTPDDSERKAIEATITEAEQFLAKIGAPQP